ncbi:hypothetical protein [Dongia deserti]|uniref:hypothetical protein n=1 Tax=Dongia deserti TaxID=2268030 RepID=UPI000E65750E|nr:hypothetical protein [Dongia deserti]
MAEAQKTLTAEQLAKVAKGVTVRVFDVDKKGNPVVDPKTKQKIVIERTATVDDILSHAVRGNRVTIVTIDGQKIEAAA